MNGNNLELSLFAQTDVGMERQHNEDNFLLAPDLSLVGENRWHLSYDQQTFQVGPMGTLIVVADGMGGTNAGEVASDIAVKSVRTFFDGVTEPVTAYQQIKDYLVKAIHFANDSIIEHARKNPETRGMGTTIILGWVVGDLLTTAWIGDSRAYLSRDRNGIKAISQDHSYVQELVDRGEITSEQAFFHPQSNVITQSLGDKNTTIHPTVTATKLMRGDRILLCSDGLNGMLQDAEIAKMLNEEDDVRGSIQQLITKANEAGGYDNITLAICEVCSTPNALIAAPEDLVSQSFVSPAVAETTVEIGSGRKVWIIGVAALALVALIAYMFSGSLTGLVTTDGSDQTLADSTDQQAADTTSTGAILTPDSGDAPDVVDPVKPQGASPGAPDNGEPGNGSPDAPAPASPQDPRQVDVDPGDSSKKDAVDSTETTEENDKIGPPSDSTNNQNQTIPPGTRKEDKRDKDKLDELITILEELKNNLTPATDNPSGLDGHFEALKEGENECRNLMEIVKAYKSADRKEDVTALVEFYKVECKKSFNYFNGTLNKIDN